jgi:hypothetical protein
MDRSSRFVPPTPRRRPHLRGSRRSGLGSPVCLPPERPRAASIELVEEGGKSSPRHVRPAPQPGPCVLVSQTLLLDPGSKVLPAAGPQARPLGQRQGGSRTFSSGRPSRPTGNDETWSSSLPLGPRSGVSTGPGATAFTRMPRGASSLVADRTDATITVSATTSARAGSHRIWIVSHQRREGADRETDRVHRLVPLGKGFRQEASSLEGAPRRRRCHQGGGGTVRHDPVAGRLAGRGVEPEEPERCEGWTIRRRAPSRSRDRPYEHAFRKTPGALV